jgi:hypothetical protein
VSGIAPSAGPDPGEDYPLEHTYRDGMKRATVDYVLEKVELAMESYVKP